MRLFRHALVLGKCLPPHQGHLALVRFACAWADRVTVLVEQRPDESVPVDIRCAWLREALGSNDGAVRVQALLGDQPQAPPPDAEGAAAFWRHWSLLLRREAGGVDAVVSGDDYGARLAADQGATWIPFDRTVLPISATAFKASPWANWPWLIEPARAALVRRLVVVGAESTGKSTLAGHLARTAHPPTLALPEYAEHWIRRQGTGVLEMRDWQAFLAGQVAQRTAWLPQAGPWIVEDSHALTTAVWAERLGQPEIAQAALALARVDRPHHVLLMAPGVPWVDAPHRMRPDDGDWFTDAFRRQLEVWDWPHTVVTGSTWTERTHRATEVRDRLLETWRTDSWETWAKTASPPPDLPHAL